MLHFTIQTVTTAVFVLLIRFVCNRFLDKQIFRLGLLIVNWRGEEEKH
jgi:hypothetical protein